MRHILILLSVLLALTGCKDTHVAGNASKRHNSEDTIYTEPKAMSIHLVNPERALLMIDSAVIVGNISRERGEYLKAVTQYGKGDYHMSRQTCLDLIQTVPKDTDNLVSVYALLEAVETMSSNFPAAIRYATEASRLAHAIERPAVVAKMEGKIAFILAETGKTDEGIDRLRAIIPELRKVDDFNFLTAYQEASYALFGIYLEHEHYAELVPLCEDVLERIDEFASRPESFKNINEDFDPAEYIDFVRGKTYAYLVTAYTRLYTVGVGGSFDFPAEMTPDIKAELFHKAIEAENEVFKTRWSQTIDCDRVMCASYHHLGQFDRFDAAMDRLDSTYTDTININYLLGRDYRAAAAQMRGRLSEAICYLNSEIIIGDSLDRRNQRDQLNELATIYHLQEEQLARQQAESDARFFRLLTIAIVIGLIAAVVFALYFFYKRRETMDKNRVLAREIAEAIKYKEMASERSEKEIANGDKPAATTPVDDGTAEAKTSLSTNSSSLSDADLFQQLREVILRDQLYLDPQLDRQALCDRFDLSKERIGAAFAKGSPFKSLIDFLNDCRLPYAAKLLTERPDLTIADVAHKSGFLNADTFSRNFKQKYALTPSQYQREAS